MKFVPGHTILFKTIDGCVVILEQSDTGWHGTVRKWGHPHQTADGFKSESDALEWATKIVEGEKTHDEDST